MSYYDYFFGTSEGQQDNNDKEANELLDTLKVMNQNINGLNTNKPLKFSDEQLNKVYSGISDSIRSKSQKPSLDPLMFQKIKKQKVSLFPKKGELGVNSVDFLKVSNANYLNDLNQFNVKY